MSTNPPGTSFETLPAAAYPPPSRRVGALWRRIVAFGIDILVIGFIGIVLGYIFFDLFMSLGSAGRLVGYLVGFFYFAIPESSFGNGQSLGKRLLLLQVVGKDGNPLSIEQSFIRYTIFAIPWFLNGLPLPFSRMPWTSIFFLGLAVYGLGGASVYLMVFNSNTRQTVYDLAVGGYVAEAGKDGRLTIHSVWRPHWAIAAAILIMAAIAGMVTPELAKRAPFAELLNDERQVEQLAGVQSASISRVTAYRAGARDLSLTIDVRCTIATADQQALANQIADSLITTDPTIQQYSALRIVLVRGYDIGIAHAFFSQTYSDSPANWRRQFFAVPPQLPAH